MHEYINDSVPCILSATAIATNPCMAVDKNLLYKKLTKYREKAINSFPDAWYRFFISYIQVRLANIILYNCICWNPSCMHLFKIAISHEISRPFKLTPIVNLLLCLMEIVLEFFRGRTEIGRRLRATETDLNHGGGLFRRANAAQRMTFT